MKWNPFRRKLEQIDWNYVPRWPSDPMRQWKLMSRAAEDHRRRCEWMRDYHPSPETTWRHGYDPSVLVMRNAELRSGSLVLNVPQLRVTDD